MQLRQACRSLIGVLALAAAMAVATEAAELMPSTQDPPVIVGPEDGHREVPDGPYISTPARGRITSPRATVSRDGYVSVQVNVAANGQNIVGDAANEPSLAVDPTDPSRMVIGWRQFNTITSNFRQAGWAYSHDAGRTWTFPGVIQPGVFRSDPVVDADHQGHFFYNSLTTNTAQTDFWCHVFRSTDGGVTWDAGTYAWGGDKQWQVIDTTNGIGRGNIYASWNYIYSTCSGHFTRSVDNGLTFQACTSAPGNPYWGTLAVGPSGELFLCGQGFIVDRSTNAQNPGSAVSWGLSRTVNLGGSLVASGGPNPGGLLGQAWVDVDRSDGPTRGNVYLLASVDPSGPDPLDVMFARSTNGGYSWSAPVRVNDDPPGTNAWQWFGTMSVAPNGRIDVIWLDTRNDPGGYDSELYYSYSTNAGQTWAPGQALTPPFDPHVGWPQQNKLGDYFDVTSDELGVDVAYAATFNGEQDVYYIRIGDPHCQDAGRLTLDRPKYACESEALVEVLDCGLNQNDGLAETVTVVVASDSEPAGETVILTETSATSARFLGTLALSDTDAAGILHVLAGDTITATYMDADDGQGGTNVAVTATAIVDCVPPIISNVQAADIGPFQAFVTFDTDELTRGRVRFGESCLALNESTSWTAYRLGHSVKIAGLDEDTPYAYVVDAEDEAGNAATEDDGGACHFFTTADIPAYFAELFTTGNDLAYTRLTFRPNGSLDFYAVCAESIAALPTDPAGGTALALTDESFATVSLTGGAAVRLYGQSYTTFYPGSNGYITFQSGSTASSESFAALFAQPCVAALFDDLNPGPTGGGTIRWKQLADRVAVTWENVPEFTNTGANTFQIELFFNGDIAVSYLDLSATDGLAGLSPGGGIPEGFVPVDLSEFDDCGPLPPAAYGEPVTTGMLTPVSIVLQATDDGQPAPLVYVLTRLPDSGQLADPVSGLIGTAPHVLADGGNTVEYQPGPCFHGQDSFTFRVNDGGTPPEGGDSNEATITVTVTGGTPGPARRIYSFLLDSDPGWSTEGQWAFGQPTGGGSYNGDPTSGYTGPYVYGYNLDGDYPNDLPITEYLTMPPMDFSNLTGAQLRFWRWLGIESTLISGDRAVIEVSADGQNWQTVWAHVLGIIADTSWTQVFQDISSLADGGATVQIRWGLGPTNSSTTYPGWNIDDVEIWGIAAWPSDFDGSNTVDGFDYRVLETCLAGPDAGLLFGCDCADLDLDGDVDLADFAQLQREFTGE